MAIRAKISSEPKRAIAGSLGSPHFRGEWLNRSCLFPLMIELRQLRQCRRAAGDEGWPNRSDIHLRDDQLLQRPRPGLIAHHQSAGDGAIADDKAQSIDVIAGTDDPRLGDDAPGFAFAARDGDEVLVLAAAN